MLRWLPETWQYRLLKRIAHAPVDSVEAFYANRSKLRVQFGDAFLMEARDKVIVDYGCGEGTQAIELARAGAGFVIGLDVRKEVLARAREAAYREGVSERCQFADIVCSIDSFEHFRDPEAELNKMAGLLNPGGLLMISFGPTWYHPLGGHLFSVFPWAHLVFSEPALIRWRADLRRDGATCFAEVEGGLNQITIKRFLDLVGRSGLAVERIEYIPIRRLHLVHNTLTREWTTAVVRARLRKPER